MKHVNEGPGERKKRTPAIENGAVGLPEFKVEGDPHAKLTSFLSNKNNFQDFNGYKEPQIGEFINKYVYSPDLVVTFILKLAKNKEVLFDFFNKASESSLGKIFAEMNPAGLKKLGDIIGHRETKEFGTKANEYLRKIGENFKESKHIEPQEPEPEISGEDLNAVNKTQEIEKKVPSENLSGALDLNLEDEVLDENVTQEMEIPKLEDKTQKFGINEEKEASVEDLEIGKLVEELRVHGHEVTFSDKIQRVPEEKVLDLRAMKKIAEKVDDEYKNDPNRTIAVGKVRPTLDDRLANYGYLIVPYVEKSLKTENEKSYKSAEEVDKMFENIQLSDKAVIEAKAKKEQRRNDKIARFMKEGGLTEEEAKERITEDKDREITEKEIKRKETLYQFGNYLVAKYGPIKKQKKQ